MEINETRKGKYSKIFLKEKTLQKRRNQCCLLVHNGFYFYFWELTLVPKLAKLHTKYLLAKRLFCFFLLCFFSCVLCLGLSYLIVVLKNLLQGL
jgi:hypothetical protein